MISEEKQNNEMRSAVVADDEPITRMDLAQMLHELGFDVKGSASDGFDAIELCRKIRPDIVLMDIKMPIFDGLSASETILKEDLAGCVVLLTAFCDKEFIDRAAQAGATGYLVKPVDERLLLPTIEVAIAQGKRVRSARTEADGYRRQLDDAKLIDRAKALLAGKQNMTEAQAYRELQQASMQKRVPMSQIAQAFLAQNDSGDLVRRAKAILADTEGLSGQDAYGRLCSISKETGESLESIARKIIAEGKGDK